MEIPISLWTEADRIFTVAPDWCQVLLYEKHGLNFVTAMFKYALHMLTAVAENLLL